jgi:hypothetical protein
MASDLIWATRIRGTADALGIAARPVRDLAMLEARLADSPVRGLIVDLEAGPTAIDLIARVRVLQGEKAARMRVCAFAPHVETQTMAAAQAAGADEVLPRGSFDRRLPEILRGLEGDPGEGDEAP